ncbi:MAG: cache domain-containing protein [Candidatus Thorarchaeota archaeon]
MKSENRKRIGIREVILLNFVLYTFIALGTVAGTSGIFIGVMNNKTSNQVINALETQVKYDMENKTFSNSLIIQSQLENVAEDLNGLANSISDIFKNPFEFGYRNSFYHVEMLPVGTRKFDGTIVSSTEYYPENIPPDAEYDPKLDLNASKSYSHYLIYEDSWNAMGQNEYNLSGIHGEIINRTAHLDPIMKEIIDNNPHYSWIYMEFEIGIQRTFPWSGVDTTIFGTATEAPFDYKSDDWYIDAKSANGNIVWTAPYIDPYIGWIVTISRAIYNGTTSPEDFIGVVGIDFTLETISQTVGNIKLFETGYGFLIDHNGEVISHPNVIFDPGDEEAVLINDIEPISPELFSQMTSGTPGFSEIAKNGKTYYLTYTPINISDYSLGIIAPSDEVLAPVKDLQESLNRNLNIQLSITFIILAIIVVIVLIVGLKISDSIVKPLKKLTNLALQLATEDIKRTALEKSEIFEELDDIIEKDDEIGGLSRSFKNLVLMVGEESKSEEKENKISRKNNQ